MQEILTDVSGVSSAAPDSISVEDPPRPVAAPSLRGKQAVSSPAIEPPVARPDLTGSSDPGLPSQGRSLSAERRPAASDQPSLAPLDESAAAAAPAMRQVRPASERPVNSDPSPQAGAPGPPQSLSAATAIAAPDVPTFDAPPLEHRADRDAARTSGRLPDWRAPEAQLIHAAIARMQIVRRLGESEFDLRLTPPELGTLRVSLRQTREGLNVQVAADDPATQSLLESSRQEIAQALQRDQPGGVKLSLQTHAEGDRPPPEPALWEDRPGAARRPTGSAPHTRSNSRLSFLA